MVIFICNLFLPLVVIFVVIVLVVIVYRRKTKLTNNSINGQFELSMNDYGLKPGFDDSDDDDVKKKEYLGEEPSLIVSNEPIYESLDLDDEDGAEINDSNYSKITAITS